MLQCGLSRLNFSLAIVALPCWPHQRHSRFKNFGAGEGNRTLVFSLEGCCSTIELHPPGKPVSELLNPSWRRAQAVVGEVGLEPTKAKPADLQSAPFAARDTPPLTLGKGKTACFRPNANQPGGRPGRLVRGLMQGLPTQVKGMIEACSPWPAPCLPCAWGRKAKPSGPAIKP